nr:DUF885 domain-containing protein [Coralloluteibacterium stylophorae]
MADAPADTAGPASTAASAATAQATADARFEALGAEVLEALFVLSPVTATQAGNHAHDAELDDYSAAARRHLVDTSRDLLARLEALDPGSLSRANQVDAKILANRVRATLWEVETAQSWAWDPQVYSQLAGGAIYSLMAREFAPLPERLRSATARMEKIPGLFAQARENLDPARVPEIHAQTVARQNAGVLSLVDALVVPHRDALSGEDRRRLDAAIEGLRAAVAEHQVWLDGTLVPNARGEFRIGAEQYDAKLALALDSGLGRAEIRQRAEAELERVRTAMYATAREVLAGRVDAPATPDAPTPAQQQAAIEAALELAYAERPAREAVVETARGTLAQATEFVRRHDLVTLPDAPVRIILMPEFQRGVAVAYCDPPGPLDSNLDTFFAVSPIPDDWSEDQANSFLREYNTRMIHLLSIHEAMPGHYLQLAHANAYASPLRAVLYSGPFVEGWAVYTERMMTEAGYLDRDPLFRLVQQKFYLRSIANAILDIGVHVEGMTREEAMTLMVDKAFQQEREAAGKWVRAQLTSAQLPTYFVGAQEHFDLRAEAERREGEAFDLKRYHDRVLSFGSPPVRYVRALMFDQPIP